MRWRRKRVIFAALFVGYCAINFSWVHAALAALSPGSNCAETLKQTARKDVATLYGRSTARPIFVCQNEPALGLRVSHGSARFTPLLPSVVVLGPKGQNSDVAAHELAHAELAKRTSALLRTYRVPTWFDEGLAMQIDHRPQYSRSALKGYLTEEQIVPLRLATLTTPRTFFGRGRAGYAFARCVVEGWFNDVGPDGLHDLVDRVGWRTPFPVDDFTTYETTCLSVAD